MNICDFCGASNQDTDQLCKECGSPLPVKNVKKRKKEKKGFKLNGKPLAICIGAVAAVAAIAAGVIFLGGGSAKAVGDALDHNKDAIVEKIDHLENLNSFFGNVETLNNQGDFVLSGGIETNVLDLNGSVDYSRSGRVLNGMLAYGNLEQELDLQFDFSADNKVFMLASDRLTADIYGFKQTEFAKKFDKTPIAKLLPIIETGDKPDMDFFRKWSPDKTMQKKYGDVWKDFKKTVRYKEINERVMQIGSRQVNCRAYEITWNKKAATRLISTILGTDRGILSGLNRIIDELQPDCRFYMDEAGYIVAAECVIAGSKCILTFEGEQNLWEKCVLRSESFASDEGDIWGELEITGDKIKGDLNWNGLMDLHVEYLDQTGEFDFEADLLGIPWEIEGVITSKDGGAQLTIGGYIPEHGNVSLRLELNPLVSKPKMLSDKYVDLFGKDLRIWERLLIDINNAD